MKKNIEVKIYTLGCKVNQYDSNKLAAELKRVGFVIVGKNANLAIINSCAVTETAMIKSGRMIKLAKKENPGAKIVLAGCWTRAEEVKERVAGVDLVLRDGDVKKLAAAILSFRPLSRNPVLGATNKFLDCGSEPAMTGRARYFIKIQDGCEQYCSYCIVPYVRGKMVSRPEREVIDEIRQAVEAGYREIVLSGIHLGLYGRSVIPAFEPESRVQRDKQVSGLRVKPAMTNYTNAPCNDNLVGLLNKIIKLDGLGRVRLSSIEITEVADELIKLMMKSKKICSHLHIPLQSGCDSVLKRMNRPYDKKYYKNKIRKIRNKIPDIAISTDVIVGFPGETEKDFRDTEKFIKQIKFSRLHVFPFSAHEKTPAAKFPEQVEEKTKARRAKLLRRLGVRLMSDYKKKFKGRELELVVEQIRQNKIIGKTEYYFNVEISRKKIKTKNLKLGEIVRIRY